jgi:cell division protein FtsB
MIPVEGHKGLYRDENTNAIVNCNDHQYQEYIKLKTESLSEKQEIENLKNELSEIKNLLKKITENHP